MRGVVHESRPGDAHRCATGRVGRAGPRDVVELCLRGDPPDRIGAFDARGGVNRHHLPDARTGLPRSCGTAAP